MSNNNIDNNSTFDEKLANLYQKRKVEHKPSEQLNTKLSDILHRETDNQLSLREKYNRFNFFKTAALMVISAIAIIPLFALLQEQVSKINTPSTIVSHEIEIYHSEEKTQVQSALPERQISSKPEVVFYMVTADNEQQKLHQFNQQIELFLASNHNKLNKQQRSLYANSVSKGKLIKQKDMWFIEFCGENMQLLAMDLIEESLLADPLLDETREGSFFDVYSNPTGVIAMLENDNESQCN
ncbi:hypothetical protein RI845_02070 [Thalassotalea nanhaiensis]|uniref:Uncharacterized protein n=1 Tax=Thalassotalea nanhaiensis TaxID=3065648 RepID=A0ABY9TJN8_9GAMM|nr:hypothetical protein RI845_02070 [Colwelliaceae bacterium SQ345]